MFTDLNKTYLGNSWELAKQLPPQSVHTIVTSPPYYGLRDYGTATWLGGDKECDHIQTHNLKKNNSGGLSNTPKERNETDYSQSSKLLYKDICKKCGATRVDEQFGLEKTPEEYVQKLVELFRLLRPALRDDGTVWLNIGDSYANYKGEKYAHKPFDKKGKADKSTPPGMQTPDWKTSGIKPKDLIGIPWMVAFALRADGWYLRSDIIWYKRNPMPESVKDRPTKSHEYIFLFSKSEKYFYDADAIKTQIKDDSIARMDRGVSENHKNINGAPGRTPHSMNQPRKNKKFSDEIGGAGTGFLGHSGNYALDGTLIGGGKANKRSVWDVTTKPYKGAHFATFPADLIEPCILAGAPENCCGQCGNPYVRMKEKIGDMKLKNGNQAKAKKIIEDYRGASSLNTSMHTTNKLPIYQTTGFMPTCACHAKLTGGGVVLDPFIGSGTTRQVAHLHGRQCIGFELNPDSIKLEQERMKKLQVTDSKLQIKKKISPPFQGGDKGVVASSQKQKAA